MYKYFILWSLKAYTWIEHRSYVSQLDISIDCEFWQGRGCIRTKRL